MMMILLLLLLLSFLLVLFPTLSIDDVSIRLAMAVVVVVVVGALLVDVDVDVVVVAVLLVDVVVDCTKKQLLEYQQQPVSPNLFTKSRTTVSIKLSYGSFLVVPATESDSWKTETKSVGYGLIPNNNMHGTPVSTRKKRTKLDDLQKKKKNDSMFIKIRWNHDLHHVIIIIKANNQQLHHPAPLGFLVKSLQCGGVWNLVCQYTSLLRNSNLSRLVTNKITSAH
jgi:hypothetical protein